MLYNYYLRLCTKDGVTTKYYLCSYDNEHITLTRNKQTAYKLLEKEYIQNIQDMLEQRFPEFDLDIVKTKRI